MSDMQANNKRRNFMRALGGGGLAALVAMLTGRATGASAGELPAGEAAASTKGYRLSEHVRAYYRTTRL